MSFEGLREFNVFMYLQLQCLVLVLEGGSLLRWKPTLLLSEI